MEDLYQSTSYEEEKLSGLGGFLIFIGISVVLTPVSALMNLSKLSKLTTDTQGIEALGLSPAYFTISKMGYTIMLLYSIIIILLFFNKKKTFVIAELIDLGFRFSILTILTFIGVKVPEMRNQLIFTLFFSFITSILMVFYYISSERVKNTFVN